MSEHLEQIDQFVEAVRNNKECFVLTSEQGLLITESYFDSNSDVLPLWHSLDEAQTQAKKHWQTFQPVDIELDELLELLQELSEEDVLVGVDLTDEQIAVELTANKLLNELNTPL